MHTIRQSIFETNSSSCHTITIVASDIFNTKLGKDDEGVVHIYPGEFGWEICKYDIPDEKASYAYTYAKNYGKKEDLKLLRKVIEDVTGAKVVFEKTSGYFPTGYIDHQSSDYGAEIFVSYDTVKNFIFNPKSYVQTDNDNH